MRILADYATAAIASSDRATCTVTRRLPTSAGLRILDTGTDVAGRS
jgi:hypothetical protein